MKIHQINGSLTRFKAYIASFTITEIMSLEVIHFNTQDRPEFYKTLKKRVNQYFKENNKSRHGNVNMVLKSVFMISLYLTPFILMLTGVVTGTWGALAMWSIMGFGMAGIGLSIMHDANHGSYSKNKFVNNLMGSILNLIGGYHVNWKIQHNVLHHSFTNIHEYDEDIEKQGIVRFSPTQEHKKVFRFQIIYAPLLYGILTLYWAIFKDYEQLYRYHKRGLLKTQGLSLGRALTTIIFNKVWYFALTIALPIILMDLSWWVTVVGFVLMQFICGMILALIFQAAHVLEETEFFEADEDNNVENNWAIHQMKTTANFANGGEIFSWFIGGLNYQVEHHLFPNICHVHYKDISKIVRETAEEFDVPYNHHKTFGKALKSHFSMLHKLGTGAYDLQKAG